MSAIHIDLGDPTTAQQELETAVREFDSWLGRFADHPSVTHAWLNLAGTHNELGNLHIDLGRQDVAVRMFQRALSIEQDIDELADRPLSQLDPVERAILLLGFYELKSQPGVPYKVVINESVNLAKRFGAVDGHKYINALLDKACKKLRPNK